MLKVHTLPLGSYQTNCYIIHEEAATTCCVIDPGYSPEIILDKVDELVALIDKVAEEYKELWNYRNYEKGQEKFLIHMQNRKAELLALK